MKRFSYIIAVLTVVAVMAGCKYTSQMAALEQIEALLPAGPDSADARLNLINLLLLKDEEWPLYALLRTSTDILHGLDAPANDSLIRPAYDYYAALSRQGTSSDLIAVRRFGQAAQHLGEWYETQDSIKACEDCFRQAIRASEKAEDWHTCYISYQRLADPVHYANDEEALALLEKSIEIYHKVNDSPRNLLSLLLLAANIASNIAYINDTDFAPALDYANKAYRMAVDSGWTDFQNQSIAILALIYWSKGDYPEALRYGKRITIDLETEGGIETNMRVAQYYLSCDSFAKAKEMYQSVRKIEDLTSKYLYTRALTEIAIHQQEKDTALFYLDSAFTCSESMYFNALKVKDDYYQQTIAHEKTQEALRNQSRRRTWIGLSVAALLTVLILFLWQKRRYERKQHLMITQHLSRENELLNCERELLHDNVKKKEGMIRFLQGYIIDRLDIAKKFSHKGDGANVTLSRKDWLDIERVLNEIDDNSIDRVRAACPHLSQDDLHLCMLVRLRMSNPAIGRLYNITPSAVQHRKQKLKKEGFGVSDPQQMLEDVIASV